MKHLLSIDELTVEQLTALLDLTDHMVEISSRPVPKVPALRGRTVASVFFEDSTNATEFRDGSQTTFCRHDDI